MLLLAIDTSTTAITVALHDGDTVVGEATTLDALLGRRWQDDDRVLLKLDLPYTQKFRDGIIELVLMLD